MTTREERLARYQRARERVSPRSSRRAFESLVAEVLDDLPAYIHRHLENVAVLVEDRAEPDRLRRLGYDPHRDLLGLYEGVNKLERGSGYHLVTPDRITLFWHPIVEETGSTDREALRAEIRKTVIHELAHHFGISDGELRRLGG
ncbi:MAG: metallopeptidase family protein [Chloroflexota bacterium]